MAGGESRMPSHPHVVRLDALLHEVLRERGAELPEGAVVTEATVARHGHDPKLQDEKRALVLDHVAVALVQPVQDDSAKAVLRPSMDGQVPVARLIDDATISGHAGSP
jgi:hypothetical protein